MLSSCALLLFGGEEVWNSLKVLLSFEDIKLRVSVGSNPQTGYSNLAVLLPWDRAGRVVHRDEFNVLCSLLRGYAKPQIRLGCTVVTQVVDLERKPDSAFEEMAFSVGIRPAVPPEVLAYSRNGKVLSGAHLRVREPKIRGAVSVTRALNRETYGVMGFGVMWRTFSHSLKPSQVDFINARESAVGNDLGTRLAAAAVRAEVIDAPGF